MSETNADREAVFARICELLEPFNKKGLAMNDETDISADLEIDSVAVLDFIMEVEDEYDISLPMDRVSEIRTIGELIGAIQEIRSA